MQTAHYGRPLPPQDAPFNFILEAKADPMSKPLERLQLVKGWVDASGQKHNRVIDVMTANPGWCKQIVHRIFRRLYAQHRQLLLPSCC